MPEISRFFGIVIAMYYSDHEPAHFHAVYSEFTAVFEIETSNVSGNFPARARRLVLEWLELHRKELLNNWKLAKARKPLNRIAPLE